MDKHSSLLRKSVNYGRKKFYSTGPWLSKSRCTHYGEWSFSLVIFFYNSKKKRKMTTEQHNF